SVGMEEEFLLLEPKSGAPVPAAATILEQLRTTAPDWQGRLKPELAASQLEATTGICDTLSELRGQLRSGRRLLARAAREHQGLLAASGTPPGQTRFLPGDGARFERITDLYRGVVADYQTCGCHVHVGVADRSTAVEIINHLRPWVRSRLAISATAPFCNGADTGYASWRMVQQTRFPGGRRAAALPVGAGLRRRARQAGGLRLPGRFPDDLLAGPTQRTVPDRGRAGRRRSPHCGRSRAAGRAGPRPGAGSDHRDRTGSPGAGDEGSRGARRAVGGGPVRPAGVSGRPVAGAARAGNGGGAGAAPQDHSRAGG